MVLVYQFIRIIEVDILKMILLKFVSQDYYFCPHIGRTPEKFEFIIFSGAPYMGAKFY